MTKYLITPTLLNSFQYYIEDEYKSPADSRADFLKTLSRERFEPNEAMQKGIKFEQDIEDYCNGEFELSYKIISTIGGTCGSLSEDMDAWEEDVKIFDVDYNQCVIRYGKIVKGGLWQQTCKKDLRVNNQDFLLYGRVDVLKRDTIYDIKFTSNYELDKYLNSSQHLIYLYCLGLPKFQYLISDGKDYWIDDYHNHAGIEGEIKSKISDFMAYLENDKEAKEMFLTRWIAKN